MGAARRCEIPAELRRHVSVESSSIHANVSASPVNVETVAFTVNNITAQEDLGAYEPVNHTNELFVKLGFHF